MSWLRLPDGSVTRLFGSGGGRTVADSLSRALGTEVPLLGQVPMDPLLGEAGDAGTPLVLSAPGAPAAVALRGIAERLSVRRRGLAGCRLPVSPS
jgi:ATP-binding protein involved in chromosome partitioning